MKKIMKLALLAFLALLACVLMFTACDILGETQLPGNGSTSETGHVHAFGEWETTKKATCTNEGVKERYCSCGEKQMGTIAATGHTEVTDVAVAPTCTQDGLTEGKHCSACQEVTVKQNTVEKNAHTYGEWETTSRATCEQEGTQERYCKCGEKQSRTVSATGHNYGDWSVSKIATCAQVGEEARLCQCGDKQTRSIPSPEHEVGKWIVDVAATCISTGSRHQECTKCQTVLKTEELAITGHKEGNYVIVKEATCTSDGQRQTMCTVCQTILRDETVTAYGHSYSSQSVSASCEKAGGTQYTCRTCSHSYTEESGAALGHNLEISGKCSRCDGDFSVDMKTRVGAPLQNAEYGFSYYGLDGYLMLGFEAKNISNKTVKYAWIQIVAYNAVGDIIYRGTVKTTGPIKNGEKLVFNLDYWDAILKFSVDFRNTAKVEIVNVKFEYTDGTIECGAYGYSTTVRNSKLYV